MKRIILSLSLACVLMICMITPVSARVEATNTSRFSAFTPEVLSTEYEYLEDGSYIETVIEAVPTNTGEISPQYDITTIVRTKTRNCYSADDELLVSVSITAEFKYNVVSSTCSDCSASGYAPNKHWHIQELTSSRSHNTATAYVVLLHKVPFISDTYDMSVTITCNSLGYVY